MNTHRDATSPDTGEAAERNSVEGDGRFVLPGTQQVVPEKDKYDESKPSARMVVVMGLLWTGIDGGLLNFRDPETALVATTYALALITALVANLVALRPRVEPGEEMSRTPGAATSHEPQIFSDPWYQVPAAYCSRPGRAAPTKSRRGGSGPTGTAIPRRQESCGTRGSSFRAWPSASFISPGPVWNNSQMRPTRRSPASGSSCRQWAS